MSFTKGNKLSQGRPKGATNKLQRSTVEDFRERYPDLNPLAELMKIAAQPDTSTNEKIQCYKEVSKYLAPALKALDVNWQADEERLQKLEALL